MIYQLPKSWPLEINTVQWVHKSGPNRNVRNISVLLEVEIEEEAK